MISSKVKKIAKKNIKDAYCAPKKTFIKSTLKKTDYDLNNLTHKSNVAVFPELGISFNRVKKSGNTSICLFLIEVTNQVAQTDYAVSKESIRSPQELSFSAIKQFPNYFSFVISRNPYTRALSTFLQKLGERQPKKYRHVPGAGIDSPEGFLRYLKYLEREGLYQDRHFWPQSNLLYQPLDKYSYVGSLEDLSSDMRQILMLNGIDSFYAEELINPHRSEQNDKTRITSAKTKVNMYYTEEAASIVSRLYASDFDIFGYSLDL